MKLIKQSPATTIPATIAASLRIEEVLVASTLDGLLVSGTTCKAEVETISCQA